MLGPNDSVLLRSCGTPKHWDHPSCSGIEEVGQAMATPRSSRPSSVLHLVVLVGGGMGVAYDALTPDYFPRAILRDFGYWFWATPSIAEAYS